MRLLSCHIDNFGKLHDYSCDFSPDLNVFVHENGWGKSTLAAFLRIMLYGFEGDGRRGKTGNERARYKPWQGGTYGGTLLFELDGDRYRLHRTFGDSRRNDRFILYDDRTGYETDRLSEPLGEALFGIDSESFKSSVCMIREDLSTRATVGIQAKIGDLAQDNADLKSYDQAVRRLKKEADRLSPDRAGGVLHKLSERDNLLASRAMGEEAMQAAVHLAGTRLAASASAAVSLEEELENLRTHSEALMQERESVRRQDTLRSLREKEQADRKKVQALRSKFPGEVPAAREIHACLEAALASASADNMLRELDRAADARRKVREIRADGRREQKTLHTIRQNHEKHKAQEAKRRRTILYALYAALSLSVLASAVCVFRMFADRPQLPGVLGFLAGTALSAALYLVIRRLRLSPKVDLTGLEFEQEELQCRRRMRALSHELKQQKEAALRSEKMICDFLTANGYAPVLPTAYSNLLQIRSHARGPAAIDVPSPEEFFRRYGLPLSDQPTRDLMELGTLRNALSSAEKLRRLSRAERIRYEKLYPEAAKQSLLSSSTEDNDSKLRRDTETMSQIHEKLLALRRQIDREEKELEAARENLRSCIDAREERLQLSVQREELQHRFTVLQKTMSYLQTAREEFTARYRNPFLRSLKRYYGMITKLPGEDLITDASLDVKIMEDGIPRDLHSYSTGSRDLLSICRRMAMIDAMYPSEKPFLILDDPFVNFDEDTADGALTFLASVSREYQILYFTCHRSRTP